MITSSPCRQFAGVATLCVAVSCIEFKHAQDLVEVAARGHWVGQHQLDLLVGADDEDRAHGLVGGRGAALGRARLFCGQHVVELGDLQVAVADDWIVDLRALDLLDVSQPTAVAFDRIDAQCEEFGVALGEFRFDLGHVTKFSGANRREGFGMRKQNRPFVADPVVEIDRSSGAHRREVGRGVVDAKRHERGPSKCDQIRRAEISSLWRPRPSGKIERPEGR